MAPRLSKTHISLLLLLCPALISPVMAQVTVRKTAASANPGLFMARFAGPRRIEAKLRRIIARSDWFTLQDVPERAPYQLQCRYTATPTPTLAVLVTSAAAEVARFTQSGSAREADWLLYRAVDGIITKVFRNPGLCAGKIAFAVGSGGTKEVYTCNFDGTGARRTTYNETISTEPSWGRAARTLVYTLYETNATSIVLVDIVRQRQRRISQFPGLNAGADLSPDGKRAALCLSRDRRIELYLITVNGGRLNKLTNDAAVESSPCWSPDGTRICYVSDRGGRPRLYVISATGGQASRLLRGSAESVSPDWSSVSNKICFATRAGSAYVLAVKDMADPEADVEVVSNAEGDWESPSWAPDGRHVVVSRSLNGKRGLCMVDTWSGRIIPITKPADHSLPSWSDLH